MKVKIFGAGSIGNHLSNAARRLNWNVDLVDVDPMALKRTRNDIYPARYGTWDESIGLYTAEQAPRGGYDLICIGTPPDSHIALAFEALEERPSALLIEKPLCGPDLQDAQRLLDEAAAYNVAAFVGYDHVVGRAAGLAERVIVSGELGTIQTLDVEFREHWGGIFAAHPWLEGPWMSYLGFWQRGGGASGEHSHAANLWQHFARLAGKGRVVEVDARLEFVRDARVDYDQLCIMTLATEAGLVGRCIQDVVTQPPRKWARMQGSAGHVEWWCGREPGIDAAQGRLPGNITFEQKVSKSRPDDFVAELAHIAAALNGAPAASPISLARGLDTMLVVAAAHLSHRNGRRVRIDYGHGYTPGALKLA